MGICGSCESAHVPTAKLILQDGRLQEFSYPVKVSYVLPQNPTYFICNADEMEFDDIVSALSDEDELQLGQLYFALPLSRLKHRLRGEEMAALAVKASSVLMKRGCCLNGAPPPLAYTAQNNGKSYGSVTVPAILAGGEGRGRKGGAATRGRDGRKFTAILSAIPE